MKKIIILTGNDLEHHYVTNALCEVIDVSAVFVDLGVNRRLGRSLTYYRRKYGLRRFPQRMFTRIINWIIRDKKARRKAMLRVLPAKESEAFHATSIVRYVSGLNTDSVVAQIKELSPDIILVYGTRMISDRVLDIARLKSLNMHTGISPHYRGCACAFWPLFNNELHMLGATVHECVSKVDAGMIYAVGRARLQRDDDMHSVFARCVKVGAEMYVRVICDLLHGQLKGCEQDLHVGQVYRSGMKDWKSEWCVRRDIRQGLIRKFLRDNENE